jgi:hypothetical protein
MARLKIYRGSTLERKVKVSGAGHPVDLTGTTITVTFMPNGLNNLVYSTVTGHVVITEPATLGEFYFTVPHTTTANYSWTTGKFYIHILFPSGNNRRVVTGSIKVAQPA